jgi:hypothetical protein
VQIEQIETPAEAVTSTRDHIIHKTRLEENKLYSPLAGDGENWFWNRLVAPTFFSVEFELEELAPGEGMVEIDLWGLTSAAQEPDHRVMVRINGISLVDDGWDGQTSHRIEVKVPDGVFNNGSNMLEIELPGHEAAIIDIQFLNWVKINYPHIPKLPGDQLVFTSDGDSLVDFKGSRDAKIFDVTLPAETTLIHFTQDSQKIELRGGHRYVAVKPGGWLYPDSIKPSNFSIDLKDRTQQADFLIIGPDDLLTPLPPLVALRESQGLAVMDIPLQAVYDQFNGGLPEPGALRSFLSFAVKEWASAPRYVLLVGDSSYDFRGYVHPADLNLLPPMMIQTSFGGQTASDILIGEIDDDPWPDLAIGRVPARTPDQVSAYVDKVLAFESASHDSSEKPVILAIADGQEARFKADAQTFLKHFPGIYTKTLIAPNPGEPSAGDSILEEINQGSWITAYFGHGSVDMWGKDKLFSVEDVPSLSNAGQLPIMLHSTCLTGLFIHPTEDSLAERLLLAPETGAIALIAPTSLTLPSNQGFFTSSLAENLLLPELSRLGDVLLSSWESIDASNPSSLEVMHTFLLFGDPTLALPLHFR